MSRLIYSLVQSYDFARDDAQAVFHHLPDAVNALLEFVGSEESAELRANHHKVRLMSTDELSVRGQRLVHSTLRELVPYKSGFDLSLRFFHGYLFGSSRWWPYVRNGHLRFCPWQFYAAKSYEYDYRRLPLRSFTDRPIELQELAREEFTLHYGGDQCRS